MPRRKTHEQFVKEMKEKNLNIKILGKYIKNSEKIECECLTHNIIFEKTPTELLRGNWCKKCIAEKLRNTKTISNAEFLRRLKEFNTDLIALEEYKGTHVKIKIKCLIDDYIWEIQPANLFHLKNKKCPKCNGFIPIKHEEFVSKIKEINDNIIILGKYKTANEKIECRCKIDDHIWTPYASNLIKNQGCPICGRKSAIEKRTKTHEQFLLELKEINNYIIPIEEYKKKDIKIKFKCLRCNKVFKNTPQMILYGVECPNCTKNVYKLEKITREYFYNNNIEYEEQFVFKDCKYINSLKFDFYLPDYNILIECDGIQHFEPIKHFGGEKHFKVIKKRDEIKNEYCKEKGISLIRIPYWEKKNIKSILEKELNMLISRLVK